jgi:hypothetical protein
MEMRRSLGILIRGPVFCTLGSELHDDSYNPALLPGPAAKDGIEKRTATK